VVAALASVRVEHLAFGIPGLPGGPGGLLGRPPFQFGAGEFAGHRFRSQSGPKALRLPVERQDVAVVEEAGHAAFFKGDDGIVCFEKVEVCDGREFRLVDGGYAVGRWATAANFIERNRRVADVEAELRPAERGNRDA